MTALGDVRRELRLRHVAEQQPLRLVVQVSGHQDSGAAVVEAKHYRMAVARLRVRRETPQPETHVAVLVSEALQNGAEQADLQRCAARAGRLVGVRVAREPAGFAVDDAEPDRGLRVRDGQLRELREGVVERLVVGEGIASVEQTRTASPCPTSIT